MSGLIQVGRHFKDEAIGGLERANKMRQAREDAGERIDMAEDQQRMSNVGMGAGIGAMVGMGTAIGGPWGAAAGAAIGLLASEVF